MDLALSWGPDGGDLALENGDLLVDRTLLASVLVSLFSDARAPISDRIQILDQDLRGYWAETTRDAYGSLLWLLWRERTTAETAQLAREYAETSLAWLLAAGIAREIRVRAEYGRGRVLELEIVLARGTSRRWASLWETPPSLTVSWPLLSLSISSVQFSTGL